MANTNLQHPKSPYRTDGYFPSRFKRNCYRFKVTSFLNRKRDRMTNVSCSIVVFNSCEFIRSVKDLKLQHYHV